MAAPEPTLRSCDCVEAPTIKTAAALRKAGAAYLSSRNWNDAYVCSGVLHLVYGNVGVKVEHRPDLTRVKALALVTGMAKSWGGTATYLSGYPAYEEDPRTARQDVGAILVVVAHGVMVSLQGNRAATLHDVVALGKTFPF